jgi:predicted dehydrogenase
VTVFEHGSHVLLEKPHGATMEGAGDIPARAGQGG